MGGSLVRGCRCLDGVGLVCRINVRSAVRDDHREFSRSSTVGPNRGRGPVRRWRMAGSTSTDPNTARLGELIATLSVASDIALGQPQESELRTCLLALALAERVGLDAATRADIFYIAQLRFIGCTAHAHEVA